jgi:hypothetical protein
LSESVWCPPAVLLIITAYWFFTESSIPTPRSETLDRYGLYGDSFGRMTSLFTALGFGGLVITLLLQQRQIRRQEEASRRDRKKEEQGRYEEILFKLMEIYRQTLSEVRVGEKTGRDVLRVAIDRSDAGIIEEGVHKFPKDLQSKSDLKALTTEDMPRIDYLHFRNFKIVATEIHPQSRLVDTFEVLLEHMVHGAPDHLLSNSYKELVFAQITFLECRYFFLVALSHPSRSHLRELLSKSEFFDRLSRSQTHRIHLDMYEKYWGHRIEPRESQPSIPISPGNIKRAIRAESAAGGKVKTKYTAFGVRQSLKAAEPVK